MKKYCAGFLASFMLFFSLTGCGTSGTVDDAVSQDTNGEEIELEELALVEANKAYTIGLSVPNGEEKQINLLVSALKKQAEEKKVTLKIEFAANHHKNQVDQIKGFVRDKAAAIIVDIVNDQRIDELIAAADDVPLIFVGHSPVSDVADDYITFIGADEERAGKIQAEFLINFFRAKNESSVRLVLMRGDMTSHYTQKRIQAMKDALDAADLEVDYVLDESGEWKQATAAEKMAAFIETGVDFQAVVCQSDEMALGCIEAMKQGNMNPVAVPVLGMDGLDEALAAVADDELALTILQDAEVQGETAINAAIYLANGETNLGVFLEVPYQPITKTNYEKFMK